MLRANTIKQRNHIKKLLESTSIYIPTDSDEGIHIDDWITFDEMAKIVDYLRTCEQKSELFERCWIEYKRKGSKKKSLDYWNKLTSEEKESVLPHIKAYVSSREITFQKDFERYLRDKIFMEVVYKNNNIIYDPTKSTSQEYMPQTSPQLSWNDYYKCYLYVGYFNGHIPDGYDDEERPNGAKITLNNGRGTLIWDSTSKQWVVNLI